MRVLLSSLLALIAGIGCARIYRPIELVQPRPWAQTGRLSARIDLQPWGDNSRYEARALHANLRVLVLSLENQSASDLEAPSLELPEGASTLSVEEALGLVKQQPALYLLYPLVPGLMIPGAESKGSFGPSAQAIYSAMAVVGLAVGLPNAIVAARSNTRLEGFFRSLVWTPAALRPGQVQRGLIFLRSPDPYAPVTLQVRSRDATGEQRLALTCPGLRPL